MMAAKRARLVSRDNDNGGIDRASLTNSNRSASCVFPLITAVLALSHHALIAAMCSYLPQDSMAIGYGLAGYATAGCAISMLGFYGVLAVSDPVFPSSHVVATNTPPQQNRTFISLFSHFLLLDALVSTCARLLLLELFFNTTHSQDTCSDTIEAIWTDQKQPSHDVVMSTEWQQALFKAGLWCRFALGAVHVASVSVLVCTCAAQGTVAVAVRSYGLQIGGSPEQDILVEDNLDENFRDVKVAETTE